MKVNMGEMYTVAVVHNQILSCSSFLAMWESCLSLYVHLRAGGATCQLAMFNRGSRTEALHPTGGDSSLVGEPVGYTSCGSKHRNVWGGINWQND